MGNDAQLLQDYLAVGSQPAFARLVQRYIDLVYSAARRQVRDEHLAQDITQAVFILLSQKAAAIRNPAALPAWLLKNHPSRRRQRSAATRRRRTNHEKEAAAMTPLVVEPHQPTMSQQIAGLLDEALAHLRERDRCAIVLRFLESKSIAQVGNSMGISQAAAQQRVTRALARLRQLFARHGLHTTADALPETLSTQPLLSAPPGLIALITAHGTANTAAASLAKATVKIAFRTYESRNLAQAPQPSPLAACVIALVIRRFHGIVRLFSAGAPQAVFLRHHITTILASSNKRRSGPTLDTTQKFPNVLFFNNPQGGKYFCGIDPTTLRTETSDPAGYIKSLASRASLNQRRRRKRRAPHLHRRHGHHSRQTHPSHRLDQNPQRRQLVRPGDVGVWLVSARPSP